MRAQARMIYRWRVEEDRVDAFVAAWARMTRSIAAGAAGARGSTLLRDRDDPRVFVAVARWDTLEQREAFLERSRREGGVDEEAGAAMRANAELLSSERFDVLGDVSA